MNKKKYYTVIVYKNGEEVDIRENVLAWNRREAYFEVMSELKDHMTWDSFCADTNKKNNV